VDEKKEYQMPISISMIAVSSQIVVADRVRTFDIARSCKVDAAATEGIRVAYAKIGIRSGYTLQSVQRTVG